MEELSFIVRSRVACLSRNPNQMDLFAVGADGSAYTAWWNGAWRIWGPLGGVFPPGTPIAALSRSPNFMDLFAVAADGAVHCAWWNGNPWRDWYQVGTKTDFPPGTPIAALSRSPNAMDLFAVAADGAVHCAWWNGNPWRDWYQVGTKTDFPPGTPIAALSRNPNHMEIWAVGPDGAVWGAWWNGSWHDWYRIATPQERMDSQWRSWGAAAGPFGHLTGGKEPVAGAPAIRQGCERGEIVWSAPHQMVVGAFRLRDDLCVEWSRAPDSFDHYSYDISFDGVSQGQSVEEIRPQDTNWTTCQVWKKVQGFGLYQVRVKGVTEDGTSPAGWTVPVNVSLGAVGNPPVAGWPAVGGLIAERWHELGAWEGPLGRPISREGATDDGSRRQRFEHGVIVTAPAFGDGMAVAAYQRGERSVEVTWGGSDIPYNAAGARVFGARPGLVEEFVTDDVWSSWARPEVGSGRYTIDPDGSGNVTVQITPAIADVTTGVPAIWAQQLPEVSVAFVRGDADVVLHPPADDGTPTGAFASHGARALDIAAHYARTHPIRLPVGTVGEDESLMLIAHLAAVTEDQGFAAPREVPSRVLVHAALKSMNRGTGRVGSHIGPYKVPGTSAKVEIPGDYDMGLKGVMVIAIRHRAVWNEDQVWFILNSLIPPYLRGRRPTGAAPSLNMLGNYEGWEGEDPVFGVTVLSIPETENHTLMIESTRLLANQLLFARTGAPEYDNVANGLTNWLLAHLQTFACHDFQEFNARPYARLSIHSLLNLHEFAADERLRTAAQIVLDYVMVKFAVSSTRQRRVSPFRRLKENLNRAPHPPGDGGHANDILRDRHGNDEVTGFFLTYAGPTTRDGDPLPTFLESWGASGLIAGLAAYRPPPAAYLLGVGDPAAPALHVINHGARPKSAFSDDQPEGGVEIYYKSRSFLLSAGGTWLNSGYGHDELSGYKDVAAPQATTLIPTRALDVWKSPDGVAPARLWPELDVTFADLIRFDPWPGERDANNMGVHRGFACGANLQVPDKWPAITGAQWDQGWMFLNLDAELPDYGRLGLFVAIYRTGVHPTDADKLQVMYGDGKAPATFGLVYAIEADTIDPASGRPITFELFRREIRYLNRLPDPLRWADFYVFRTIDNHTYDFWLRPDSWKHAPRIFKENGNVLFPNGFAGSTSLVDGPFLSTHGQRDGLIEIRHPGGQAAPLVLDFRDSHNPVYGDNLGALPGPWVERCDALGAFAQQLDGVSRYRAAADTRLQRVTLEDRLAVADPPQYTPRLAEAIFDLLSHDRVRVEPATAQALADRDVMLYEQLAGLRAGGGVAPVDYDNLAAFAPNYYWGWHQLSGSLFNLAWVRRDAADQPGALVAMQNRLKVVQHLKQIDPATYAAKEALAQADVADFAV